MFSSLLNYYHALYNAQLLLCSPVCSTTIMLSTMLNYYHNLYNAQLLLFSPVCSTTILLPIVLRHCPAPLPVQLMFCFQACATTVVLNISLIQLYCKLNTALLCRMSSTVRPPRILHRHPAYLLEPEACVRPLCLYVLLMSALFPETVSGNCCFGFW